MSILKLFKEIPVGATFDDVLKLGDLDFTAASKPVYFKDDNGNDVVVPFHKANYRKDTDHPFGIVKSRYEISQYRSQFSVCEVMAQEQGVEYVGVVSVDQGNLGFIVMKTPDVLNLGGGLDVKCHFYMSSSHDGSKCLEAQTIPVIGNSGGIVALPLRALKVRHTKRIEEKIAVAKGTLAKVRSYWKEAKDSFETMARLTLSADDIKDYLEVIIEGDATRSDNIRGEIMDVYNSSLITAFPATRNTLLGAYFSVVNWVDGFKNVKKSKKHNEEDALIHSRLAGAGATQKSNAYADALDFYNKMVK